MAEIFTKKNGSEDSVNNYHGFHSKFLRVDLVNEKVYIEFKKQYKNSNDEVITEGIFRSHELPSGAFSSLLSGAKLTALANYADNIVNPT
jgi:hypothetical protein